MSCVPRCIALLYFVYNIFLLAYQKHTCLHCLKDRLINNSSNEKEVKKCISPLKPHLITPKNELVEVLFPKIGNFIIASFHV